jgi:nucleotide-binding universal stress UspA family protein
MYERVLVPLDGSSLAESALPHVVAFAKAFGSKCILVRVLEGPASEDEVHPVNPLDWRIKKAQATSYLEERAESLRGAELTAETVVLEGTPAARLCEYAQEEEIGLIIMSSHGQSGISRWNVSSVVQKTTQRARTSILIVRAYQPKATSLTGLRYRKVVLALDGSRRAEMALSPVTTLVQSHGAALLLVHVVERPQLPLRKPLSEEDRKLVEGLVERKEKAAKLYLDELKSQLSVAFEARTLVCDDVPASLHQLIRDEQADLLVLTAHGHSGDTQRHYGSLTLSFIEYGAIPMLIVQDLAPEEIEPMEAELAAKETKGH